MIDSVKCLGFNELLKKEAKTSFEIYCKYKRLDWKLDTRFADEKWVSVDVLKEFTLAKEHSLRNIVEDMKHIPSRRLPLGKNAWLSEWSEVITKLEQVFDETFSEEKKERSK